MRSCRMREPITSEGEALVTPKPDGWVEGGRGGRNRQNRPVGPARGRGGGDRLGRVCAPAAAALVYGPEPVRGLYSVCRQNEQK